MRSLNCIVIKTLTLFSDGSYSFCNLNNFNKNVYCNTPIFKVDINLSFINKNSNNKVKIIKPELFRYNIKNKR